MANPVTWFEIIGQDSEGLQKFYRDVFKWKLAAPIKEMGNYSMLEGHEPGIGGGIGGGGDDGARITIYIEVDDPQKYMDRAVSSGATVMMPVETITPTTTIGIFRDPAGNMTGIMKANPRPQAAKSAAPSRAARPKAKASATSRRKPVAKATRRSVKKTAKKTTKRRRS
jgi:predicted enzyme related to lactoylglutathione lyase